MTAIYRHRIDHPSAWTVATAGGKEGLTLRLDDKVLGAFDLLLASTSHIPSQQVTRREFDHPIVNDLLSHTRELLMRRKGIVVISGVTPDRYDTNAFERIYWGIGTHLGIAATQSKFGDRLGYVENKADDNKHERGYRSMQELHMHTDSYELVGLMCIRKAKVGGLSGMASSLAIHNEILETRPELLPALYRGYRYASGEAKYSSRPITDEPIPIFTAVDHLVSCTYERLHIRGAAALLKEDVPDDLEEALNYFETLAVRDDLRATFQLEPGEIMLWHNYTNLHSRTAFEDSPDHKRLLLRLWLTVPDGRPVDPSIRIRADTYERLYREALQNSH